jgi:hypothetical protein
MGFLRRLFGDKPSAPRHPYSVIQFPLHVPVENRIAYDETRFADPFAHGHRPLALAIEVNRVRSFIAECIAGRGSSLGGISQAIERGRLLSLFSGMQIDCGKCGQNYLTAQVLPALVDEGPLPRCSSCAGTTAVLLFDEIGASDLLPDDADAVLAYMRLIAEGWWSSGVVSEVRCATCSKPVLPGRGFYYPPCSDGAVYIDCDECGEQLQAELADNPLKFGERQLRLARHYFGDPQAASEFRMCVARFAQGLR